MEWRKNKNLLGSNDFLAYKQNLFGCKNPEEKETKEYKIPNLKKVIDRILEAKKNNELIYTVGDYDADGVFSLAELDLLYKELGIKNYILRTPRRISEGYGLSFHIVKEIIQYEPGLCILVDNGIAAYEQVEELINYGWDIIIMDHHQRPENKELPPADIIIDPEAIPGQADFIHYCGAGLVYKLAENMSIKEETKKQILSYAAIATCADCVPLVDIEMHTYDNWLIVRNGLKNIVTPSGRTKSLYVLLRSIGIDSYVTESDFGFRIGPIVNASGRLFDDGAQRVLEYFTNNDASFQNMEEVAAELIATNNKRKDVQKSVLEKVKENIKTPSAGILVIYEPDIPEGIVGLVAGDLTNNYKIPSIVLTKDSNGELKGSSRSTDNVNIIELLFKCQKYLLRCGGHKKAAGLGLSLENLEAFKKEIEVLAGPYEKPSDIAYYDYSIMANEAKGLWEQIEKYAPYGEGNSYPYLEVKDFDISDAKIIGATHNTLKLTGKKGLGLFAVNFTGVGKEEYTELGLPEKVNLYGQLSVNMWNGRTELQIRFDEMKKKN